MKAPLPSHESARLKALYRYGILDTLPEQIFDDLTNLAAQICGTPTALISFIDTQRQWFKSQVGSELLATSRDVAFCAHTILQSHVLIVPDARQDDRFVDNPLVTAEPQIRFYAGAPLITPDHFNIGTLCLIDYVPRQLSSEQQAALQILARQVMTQLELRRNLAALKSVIYKYQQTEQAHQESEQRYRDFLENTNDLIQSIAPDGGFIYINRAWQETLGYSEAEISSLTVFDIIHPDNQEHWLQAFGSVMSGEKINQIETALMTKDGQKIWVEGSINCKFVDGKPVSTRSILRNVTERKQAQTALQRAYNNLELRVDQRTAELKQANERLQREILERSRAEEEVWLLQRITQAISESQTFDSALEIALKQICEFTGWCFGEAWIPCSNTKVLKLGSAWHSNTYNLEQFRRLSQKFTFPPATGLPGSVWSLKQPKWIQDIGSEPKISFTRSHLAIAVGFKAALGIPIVAYTTLDGEPEVLAVLVFFMLESCEEDKRQVEIISTVAAQLGSLIQRKHTESALRESEELYRAVVEQTSEGIFLVDAHTKHILEANAAFGALLGYTPNQILGLTLYDIFALDQEMIDSYVQQALREKHLFIGEAPHRYRDGSLIYAEVNVNVIFSGGKEVFCIVCHNITERKQAEEALRSSVATNRALLNAIPDLMFRLSREGIFVNFKAAKDNNLLLPVQEFLGKHLYEVLPQEVAQMTMNCAKRALNTGEIQIFEAQVQTNNTVCDYEFRLVTSAENEVMVIVRDITERKQAEADIRNTLEKEKELSELKSRFVTTTSHEFRTPLTTILSSAELLEDYSNRWTEEKKLIHIHRIQATVKHMTHLLNDVLLIGKAEVGKLECNPVLLDLTHFCRDLVDEIQITTEKHTINFVSQCSCLSAYLDEKLLRHILSNLLSNAIKYSPKGGSIQFDLYCEQREVIFRVQDQGIGIPVADLTKLFDSFHRASNVGTISGTGLGLAIVKQSVDLHGGKIVVESEVGVGTTFVVSLPLNK